jgi:hypothetical protein
MLVGGLGWWRGVEESGVQIFQRFASGLPKILQAKRTRGLGCCCYSAEGRKRGRWLRLVSLDRFASE